MSRHDDGVSMRHMLDHAREAMSLIQGRTRHNLESDRLLQLGLTRLVEIVAEAASRVSPNTRQQRPEIPWAAIVGMRHRRIHGYDIVDWDLLWAPVQNDLPPLVRSLEAIIGRGESGSARA